MNESVTSVSKKEERLVDAAAAITVLNNDDLRRSGATTIADALRLVPGLAVGSANSSQWAVTGRGFNSIYANKLLVLVDGRAVYSPIFGGVYWDLQQTMLEDVDRVEVIRGPGATLWGANAVNGVINVVTRSAKDTQGTLLYGGGGTVSQAMGGGRYGGKIGENTYYRVFGSYQLHDDFPLANGQSAKDGWQGWQGGYRVDHYPSADSHMTWQADATTSELSHQDSDAYNVNTLGRWTHQLGDRSNVEIQGYYDRTHRNDLSLARLTTDTLDLTAQHTFGLGERNDVIWGVGYRFVSGKAEQTNPTIQIRRPDFTQQLPSAFIQDEFRIVPDKLSLTLGSKIEHNDFTGFEIQPSARLMFKPTEQQTVWAAVSRAVRSPSEVDGRNTFVIPVAPPVTIPGAGTFVPSIVGNDNLLSESLWAYELGYRVHPNKRLSLDISTFYNRYDRLSSIAGVTGLVPGAPFGVAEIKLGNLLHGETYGGEVSATLSVSEDWRLIASYSMLFADLRGAAGQDAASTQSSPRHQVMLRSAFDVTKRVSLDAQVRYVGPILGVSSYFTADVRLSYRMTDNLEFSLVGQNLLADRHAEQGSAFYAVTAEVPRGVYGKLTWHF